LGTRACRAGVDACIDYGILEVAPVTHIIPIVGSAVSTVSILIGIVVEGFLFRNIRRTLDRCFDRLQQNIAHLKA
jgi:hypothetical protein